MEEKDELRRRKEKEKTDEETDKEALRLALDAMQRKCEIAENELKLAEKRSKVQSNFILSLEKRIAAACKNCREQDPELMLASLESANMLELKDMMRKQSLMIEELRRRLDNGQHVAAAVEEAGTVGEGKPL